MDDFVVAGAATQVACKPVPGLLFGGVGVAIEQRFGSDHNSGRANATLQPAMLQQLLLYGVEHCAVGTSARTCPGAAKNILGSPLMTACIGSLLSGVFMPLLPR